MTTTALAGPPEQGQLVNAVANCQALGSKDALLYLGRNRSSAPPKS